MKKILFATTALVATAGVAAADVSISGRAGFGVIQTQAGAAAKVTNLINNFDLYFTGTTETDGGVSLSATVEMEGMGGAVSAFSHGNAILGNNNYAKSAAVAPTAVFSAKAGALSFTFGNTDGAFDRSMTEVHRIAGIGYENWAMDSFIDNNDGGNIARLEYAAGGITASLSYAGLDDSTGVGIKYSGDLGGANVTIGAAFESQTGSDYWGISGRAAFGAFSVGAGYADGDAAGPFNGTWNISAGYSANGVMVAAMYGDSDTAGTEMWNLMGTYDLGGGATAFAQYGERQNGTNSIASMGVSFSF
ncbi:porin [Pseudooceanicola sp.]|uniref:porin n=1 Tax=Pseudooceanicola sp. TaxID=1914328 RepID=UPI0035C74668